jgi:hypothetical protein
VDKAMMYVLRLNMELTLKEYLKNFFGAKESFFLNGLKCEIDFRKGDLGFVSQSLLSKVSFSTSFIPLREAFPNNKKIYISYELHPHECQSSGYSTPSGTFKEAIIRFDRHELDLKHDDSSEEDFDEEKYLKKNKLESIPSYINVSSTFNEYCEAYFHHDYEVSKLKIMNSLNLSRRNYFLLKKRKRIFFMFTDALKFADWINIKI